MSTKKLTTEEFIKRSQKHHGDYYDYSKSVYVNIDSKVIIICPEHGEFEQIPYSHMKGRGCARCAMGRTASSEGHSLPRSTKQEFVYRAKEIHGDLYEYPGKYKNARTKFAIVCKEHGEFLQPPYVHLRGSGCPKCASIARGKKRRSNTQEFIKKAKDKLGVEYDYSLVKYRSAIDKVRIICPVGHEFEQQPNNHLTGYGCPTCQISPLHQYLHDNLGGEINNRAILDGKEIDLWFPYERVGVEVNGVYYHSVVHKPKYYHQEKTDLSTEKGLQLLHIWYDRNTDFDLVLSVVKNKLGRESNRIYARKTRVGEVEPETYRNFLSHNHLQGAIDSGVRLGLFSDGELVSVMGFKKHNDGWHLSRFANKRHTSVVGGFSKLLKYFINNCNPEVLVTYSDMAYSDGGVYEKNGFELISISKSLRLYYTDGNYLVDRWQFQRKNILKRNPDMELGPEREMALQEGFYPLYGCKTVRWELRRNK